MGITLSILFYGLYAVCSPALLEALNECMVERYVLGDGLDDGPLSCHVTYGPLAHPGAAQTENVTAGGRERERESSEIQWVNV